MTHAILTIDGQTRLDSTLDEWHRRPPELLVDMIKPGAKSETYLKAAAIALAEATMLRQPVNITITTWLGGWTMTVDNGPKEPSWNTTRSAPTANPSTTVAASATSSANQEPRQ